MRVFDLIEETRREINAGAIGERNVLATSVTTTSSTLTMVYPLGSIGRGTRLSIELEDFYVWSFTNLTLTADGAQNGSVFATHAAGTQVFVNPKFSNWDIFKALNVEINALSAPETGLFNVETVELTYNPSINGYDLTGFTVPASKIIDIMEVRYSVPGVSREYPLSYNWELVRDMSDEFPSGAAIFVRDAYPHRTVLVKAKTGFSSMTQDIWSDISVTRVDPLWYDILSVGAAWRLTSALEMRRNDITNQGDTRRADEVPPGALLGASREIGRVRQQRINEEVSRLREKYPTRMPRYPYAIL